MSHLPVQLFNTNTARATTMPEDISMSIKWMPKRPTIAVLLEEIAPHAADYDCTLTIEATDGNYAGRLRYHFADSPDEDELIDLKISPRRSRGHFLVEVTKHLGMTDIIREKYVVTARGSSLFAIICLVSTFT